MDNVYTSYVGSEKRTLWETVVVENVATTIINGA